MLLLFLVVENEIDEVTLNRSRLLKKDFVAKLISLNFVTTGSKLGKSLCLKISRKIFVYVSEETIRLQHIDSELIKIIYRKYKSTNASIGQSWYIGKYYNLCDRFQEMDIYDNIMQVRNTSFGSGWLN